MNLTGQWRFFEEFEAGFDMGYALLKQIGMEVSGSLTYTEYIYDEASFLVDIEVKGEIDQDQLVLRGIAYTILESACDIEYCLDDRIAEFYDPDRIEGSSVDDQSIEGRFVLKRLDIAQS